MWLIAIAVYFIIAGAVAFAFLVLGNKYAEVDLEYDSFPFIVASFFWPITLTIVGAYLAAKWYLGRQK